MFSGRNEKEAFSRGSIGTSPTSKKGKASSLYYKNPIVFIAILIVVALAIITGLFFGVRAILKTSQNPEKPGTDSTGMVLHSHQSAFRVVINKSTWEKAREYAYKIQNHTVQPGLRLQKLLTSSEIDSLTAESLIVALLKTKECTFASDVERFAPNWTSPEVSILADLTIMVDAKAFDNSDRKHPIQHKKPMDVTVTYVNGIARAPGYPDYEEAKSKDAETEIYGRRIVSALVSFSKIIPSGHRGLVTMQAIGCGNFRGKTMTFDECVDLFKDTVDKIARKWSHLFSNLDIWLDVYTLKEISHTTLPGGTNIYRIPNEATGDGSHAPCRPLSALEDFNRTINTKHVALMTISPSNPLAWPGNYWLIQEREGGDACITAATSILEVITKLKGKYRKTEGLGYFPEGYATWEQAITSNKIRLDCKDRIYILTDNGDFKRANGNGYI